MSDKIRYGVEFQINQNELNKVKTQLQDLQKMTTTELTFINPNKNDLTQLDRDIKHIHQSAAELEKAFDKAFNKQLGTLNLKALKTELSNLNLDKIGKDLSNAGIKGQEAFQKMSSAALNTNLQLKESHKVLDKIGTTLANSFKWSAASSIVNRMAGSIEGAWNYAKSLDTSLNNIRIVSSKSADEMERFARTANQAAQRLGKSTTDYTNAALIYYQQGLGDQEAQKRAEVTLKAANVTGQSTKTVSEQLTSVWNGYNITVEQSEAAIDKLAAVAATTASDLEELSTGMSKVASAANIMGVDIDQLSAQLATIISVTRQAPESVGTALKTIYARMGDIQAGLDGETSLDQYTKKMNEMGVNVLNAEGKLRDMGEVIEEVGEKWPQMSREQQVALSQIMAGTRQYNNLLSLFNNWDMYKGALKTSKTSLGTLQEQQDTYMESTQAHIAQLDAAWERLFDSLVNNEGANGLIDIFTGLTNGMANFTEAIGGGVNALTALGAVGIKVFNKQLAGSIMTSIKNANVDKNNLTKINNEISIQEKLRDEGSINGINTTGIDIKIEQLKKLRDEIDLFDTSKIDEITRKINELGDATTIAAITPDKIKNVKELINRVAIDADIKDVNRYIDQGGKVNQDLTPNQKGQETRIFNNVEKEIENARNLFGESDQILKDLDKSANKSKELYIKNVHEMKDKAEELQSTPFLSQGMINNIEKDLKPLRNQLKNLPEDMDDISTKTFSNIERMAKQLETKLKEISTQYKELYKDYDDIKAAGGSQAYQDQQNKKKTDYEEGFTNDDKTGIWDEAAAQRKVQSILQMTSSVMALASAFQSLSNIGNIWTNDNLSTGEKFVQIIMNVTSVVGMLAMAYLNVRKALTSLTAVEAARNALKAKGLALTTANIAKEIISTTWTKLKTAATWEHIAAMMVENWYYAAAVIAIVAVIAAIGALTAAYNADSDAAKKAAESAKALEEEHNEVAQELDNLKASFDAYDTAKEKLDGCIEGTEEWKAALEDTNKAALDLIENINGLSGDDIRDLYDRDIETGEIKINENKAKEVIQKAEDQELAARLAAASASKDATYAANKAQALDLMRDNANKTVDRNGLGAAIKYGGFAIGIGTGLAANAGANIAEEIKANQDKDTIMANLDKFNKDQTLNEFKKTLTDLGINVSELTNDELSKLQDSLQSFAQNADAATEKLKLMTEVVIKEKLGDRYDGAEQKIASNVVSQEQQKIKDEIIKLSHDMWAADNAGHANYQEIASRLNKATGGKYSAATGNTVLGTDDNRRFIFQDENGEKTEEKSEQWVANTIAAYEALQKHAEVSAEEAAKAFNKLENEIGENFTNGIKKFITDGNLESLTQDEIQKLMGMDKDTLAKAMGVNTDQIDKLLGSSGFDGLKKAGENYQKALNSLLDGSKEIIKTQFKNIENISKLSLSQQKGILNTLNSAYVLGGEELVNSVSSIFQGMSEEELGKWDEATKDIDWSTITAEEFREKMKGANIEIKASNEALEKYIKLKSQEITAMEDTNKAYGEANKISSKLKQRGDTISAEDYAIMVSYLGTSIDQYFTRMLDGTYKLIVGADQLQKTVDKIATKRALTSIENQLKAQEKILQAGQKISDIKNTSLSDEVIESRARGKAAKDQVDFLDKIINPPALNITGVATQKYDPVRGTYYEIQSTQEELNEKQKELLAIIAGEASKRGQNVGPSSSSDGESIITKLAKIAQQTKFGNVDLNNRQRLALDNGKYATVQAYSGTYGKDKTSIAVTPILQTENGPVKLSKETVSKYLNDVLEKATDENGNLNTKKIFEIDKEGLQQEGQFIKGLIADVGENAEYVAQVMHFLGKDGELAEGEYLSNIKGYQDKVKEEFKRLQLEGAKTSLNSLDEYAQATNNEELKNKVKGWREELEKNKEISKTTLEDIQNTINDVTKTVADDQLTLANSKTSFKDLYALQNEEAYKNDTGKSAINQASLNLYNQNRESGLDTAEIKEYSEYIQEIASSTNEFANDLSEGTDKAAEKARDLAIEILRMNEGVETLADNWKNWSSILSNQKDIKSSREYMKAINGTKEAVADLLDMDKEYVSESFILDHMKQIGEAAKGSASAIDELKRASLDSVMENVSFKDNTELVNSFKNTMEQLRSIADAQKLEVGTDVDLTGLQVGEQGFLDWANNMMVTGQATAADINAALSAIGYNPVWSKETQTIPNKQTITTTHHTIVSKGKTKIQNGVDEKGKPKYYDVDNWDDIAWSETQEVGKDSEIGIIGLGTEENKPTIKGSDLGIKGSTSGGKKLGGVSKKANGSYQDYSSKNKGGPAPGKSGGGGSDKKPKQEKHLEDEYDRYHKVNTQLEKIDNNLKKIQSQEKKFTGVKLINNLNGQLDKLDRRIDNLREKEKIAYGEQDELAKKLAAQGVKFNDDRTISNYMQILEAKKNEYNALVDQYNSLSVEQQEKWDENEILSKAKENYEKFKENLDRYDELVSDFIPGIQQEIQDAIDEEIELNIKKFNLEFEVRLEIADAQKDWNEFKRKILDDIDDDDILGNARARATDDLGVYLSGTDGKDGLLGAGVKQTQSILKELKDMDEKGWSNVYGDDRVSALEDLQEAYQNVEQSLMEIKEIQEDVAQAVLDQMDAVVDAMDKVADLMDTVDSQIEHDIKVIEMVYGETDYDAKGKYMEQRQKNNLDTLGTAKENRDYWEQQMNLIDDKTSEAYQKAQENFFKYNDAVNDAIEKSIEDAQEKAENAIDGIFKKYNDEITNGKGLDYTEQQWELVNDVADQYLDTVNAAFGIRQLEGKWKDAIDQTDNIGAQKKLNTLMEEQLKKLREKDKLTEYDIERAEKEYEIALKKLALEEAQQTKSTMRLRRDSQGNYRYEYVADENQIAKLQDELDALENSLYNFDKERWLEMQNQVVDAVRDRQDAIKEILMDASLTEEERLERLEEINKLYNEKIQNITDQAVTAQTNLYDSGATELAKIWDEQGKDFQNLSDEEQRILVEEMLPQFETGVNEMIDKFSGPGGFEDTTTGSMDALSQATQDYQNDLDDVENQAGITFDEIRNGQDDVLDRMPDMINDAEDYVEVMQDELSELQDINEELKKKLDYYKQIQIEAKKAATEAYNYWLKEQQIAAEKYAQENAKNNNNAGGNNGNAGNGNNNNNNKGHSGSSNRTLNQDTMNGIAGAIWIWGSDKSGWGTGETRWARLREKFGAGYDKQVQDYINSHQNSSNWKDWNSLKNYYYGSFDTGGYTGDWTGDYGKPILAHKKELILNADDTENMLDMLSITRDVVAAAGPRGLGSRLMIPQSEASALEQNVHIEATFPGVEDAAEIKQALNDLVNMAAQRANRNTRG